MITDDINNMLRDFQAEDLPWFLANRRSLNLYEPRLGKTVVTTLVGILDPRCNIVLIACPKNAMSVWKSHIERLYKEFKPETTVEVRLVKGKNNTAKEQRHKLWLKPRTAEVTFYIVTFAALLRDFELLTLPSTRKSGLIFNMVIGDEVHLQLRNRKNKMVQVFKTFVADPTVRFHALSGTMASKGGPSDFWAVLNLIDQRAFSSYWKFVYMFHEIHDGTWGKEIIGLKNIELFHKAVLEKYSRRRFRAVCAPHMPKVTRELLHVEMNAEQQQLYNQMETDNFVITSNDNMIVASTSLENLLRKSQILTCPAMLGGKTVGAAMEDLIDRLSDADSGEDTHVVIFSRFRKALPYFEKALRDAGFNNVWQLYGGLEPEVLDKRTELFRKTKGIILCSIKYAQAFSLVPAITSYVIGYEWDPNDNKQAEDRLVPQQGTDPIMSYYYSYDGTSDAEMAYAVTVKNKRITVTTGSASDIEKVYEQERKFNRSPNLD